MSKKLKYKKKQAKKYTNQNLNFDLNKIKDKLIDDS